MWSENQWHVSQWHVSQWVTEGVEVLNVLDDTNCSGIKLGLAI